jgi:hypothetical protein
MSRFTSALVFTSPVAVSPFYSEDWRVSWSANLVEGSSGGPYWLPLPSFPEQLSVESMVIDSLEPELVADSLVLLLAVVFGGEALNWLLRESHNLTFPDTGKPEIAPFWELADDVRDCCIRDLIPKIKIGVAILDEESIFTRKVIAILSGYGFQVETFARSTGVDKQRRTLSWPGTK